MRNAYFVVGVVLGAIAMAIHPGAAAFAIGFAVFAFLLE